jgi:transposase
VRFIGIDIAAEAHVVAILDEQERVEVKPTTFTEDAAGYEKLFALLGTPADALVAMEATGHYWKNLFAALVTRGFSVALLNAVRTHRFAGEDLKRAKTDALDALGIARFGAQKRPAASRLTEAATEELRELVRLRERLVTEFAEKVVQLHRLVDLGFPEFTRYVRTLDSQLASAILRKYPTAAAFADVHPRRLAKLCYDGRHVVGDDLARSLIEAAKISVGAHHGPAYRIQVQYVCEDLDVLRRRIRDADQDIANALANHEVGKLLTTIHGIGPQTAATLVAELGDPADFRNAAALAAYVGVVPATSLSGKSRQRSFGMCRMGNSRVRAALWMPTLTAVRLNPWLRAYYEGLRARGKPAKVALIASMRKLLAAVHSVARHRKAFVYAPALTEVAP